MRLVRILPVCWLALAGPGRTETDSVEASFADTATRGIPLRWLPMEVRRYRLEDLDSAATAPQSPATAASTAKDGSKLKVGGSKTVKVGVGGDGGVALDQTLFLTAEGELSPGVRMKARLSDGEMPLSPQGSSAALREVDQIFLEVESDRWRLRLGDQDWTLPGGIAPGAERKLRGISAGWTTPVASATGTLGGPQAKWKRVTIPGVEGRQEGYVLASWQGGLHGVVVPGSERVRVNGENMVRGADADYTVRYSDGLLDFTTRRRISSGDVVEVEFQSAELDYERTFAAGRAEGRAGGLRWEAWGARESDDAASPLAFAQDTATRRILESAGADTEAARTGDGQILPIPVQTGEAGLRLRLGDSGNWIAADMRASEHDANVLSGIDSRRVGLFGTGAARIGAGRYLDQGGIGRFSLGLFGQRIGSDFLGISATDSSAQANDGIWAPAPGGSRTAGQVGAIWQARSDLALKLDAGGRDDANGWSSRTAGTLGLDRGTDKRILAGFDWNRLDDGLPPLDKVRLTGELAWPVGRFSPSVSIEGESRDRRSGRAGGVEHIKTGAAAKWRAPAADLEIQTGADFRRDAVGTLRAFDQANDTARSVGAKSSIRWTPRKGDLDLAFDWKRLRSRELPDLPWIESSSWLGSATAGIWPVKGLRGQGRWKLSSSSYQPEIARYDTVPAGTGTWRYDTLLRIVVPSDEGDLRLAGMRLDTSRAAVLASQRELSVEAEFEPGKAVAGLGGFFADIGLRGHAEWNETDSSPAIRIWPHFSDDELARAIDGRSELSVGTWWTRGAHRLEFDWTRMLSVQASPILARLRDISERARWASSAKSGHRLDIAVEHGDLRDAQSDRLRLESHWSTDPSVGIRLAKRVELRPGWYSKWGEGSEGKQAFEATLQAPYANLRADLPRGLALRSEVRRVQARVDALAGSRLSDGYPEGATWRTSASLDWSWKDHVQAKAEWVARKEPDRAWFQKLTCEAKAIF
ncbi:MAG TPA: hypothetical protein PK208_10790 [Fibrobacteria bacterium]|nr:hypothetical protein [Fibrobacteria bacterium]